MELFGSQSDAWRQIVMAAALLSIVIGALGAIGQENLKRLLAYSSINNVGFILLGLVVANQAGASAMLVYRSEEHTSELQSLMRISYAVFCLKKKTKEKRKPRYTT